MSALGTLTSAIPAYPMGKATLQAAPGVASKGMEPQDGDFRHKSKDPQKHQTSNLVVEKLVSVRNRHTLVLLPSKKLWRQTPVFGDGWGPPGSRFSTGSIVPDRSRKILKLKGTKCGCVSCLLSKPTRVPLPNSIGQRHYCSLPEQAGGHEKQNTPGAVSRNSGMGGKPFTVLIYSPSQNSWFN